jgi:hypothetical protein
MTERPHVIEIDRIVLNEVPSARPGRLTALIEAEVGRVLGGLALPAPALANREASVAGEIARTVVRSIRAGAVDV